MNTLFRTLASALFLILAFAAIGYAQSAEELALARQLAKEKGYSESYVNSILNKRGGLAAGNSKTVSATVNRNDANADLQSLLNHEGEVRSDSSSAFLPGSDFSDSVYCHNIFRRSNLNFVPSYNIPTPANYILSAGDEVVIDLWGAVVSNLKLQISPEGSIYVPDLGPVYIYGQTVAQAEKSLKSYLSKIHSGLSGENPDTFMKLSLGKMRSVTINVLGDVVEPGSYTLPSLSSIASAIYLAGGPDNLGTIRDIRLYRNNKLVSSLDIYDYMVTGNFEKNVRLEDNDAIIVSPYIGYVSVYGAVKRPMVYEMKEGETLADLFKFSGGFKNDAYTASVQIDRRNSSADSDGPVSESFNVSYDKFPTFQLKDGDKVTVLSNNSRFMNRVSIEGAVWRPGLYSLSDSLKSVKELIILSGGLRDEAYLQKAYLTRFGRERNKEMVSFSLQDVILGKVYIELKPDDHVYIYDVNTLKPDQKVTIRGEVNAPGEFEYRNGMTLGDLILMAGGTSNAATLERVEVARRISNAAQPESVKNLSDTIAVVLSYNLMRNPQDTDVKIEPFDMVFIRKSVFYKPQEGISINGEVNYPGTYVVEKNTVRLSDIVSKAGGFSKDAYIKGAKLTRVLTAEEMERLQVAMEIAKKNSQDSTIFESTYIGDRFTIAIDLSEAFENPGSDADIVLRENDIISVPKYNNTVKVSGGVLCPNTVSYSKNLSYKDYINGSGGYLKEAMKDKVYMVHMNGSVASKGSKDFKVQPGTEIVVPMKKRRENGPQTLAAIMSMATSVTSIAAMVATITSVVK